MNRTGEATFVESLVVLNAVGGECLEDFERLREDAGLATCLGHALPSPEAARKFLYAFHDEALITAAQDARPVDPVAHIPEENAPLRGLGRVNGELVREVGRRCPDQRIATVETYYYRGDSACHEHTLIDWLRDPARASGPTGVIQLAISAKMTPPLRDAVGQVADTAWVPYGRPHPNEVRECAEVDFVPREIVERKDAQPVRYVAIRIRKRQGELFEDGALVKHYAVLSNLWDTPAPRLIEWHREKAGTIEGIHDVVKNELAGGILPCKYFGANAAWFRLAVIAHNVLTALKRLALPADLLRARPKRLRFLIFSMPGRLVQHARQMVLRVATTAERIGEWLAGLRALPVPA